MPNTIQRDIYKTVSYFSFFGYPLTIFQIWKWLYRPEDSYTYQQIYEAVFQMKELQSADSFFGIETEKWGSVENQVRLRKKRYVNAIHKYKKMRWYVRWLALLPTVEGVAVCNSLAWHHTRESSDIDLFVITKPGRTWTTRFLSVFPLLLFRQRPGEVFHNPIDVSFFVSSDALNIARLRIGEEDPYLSYWVRSLMPVIGRDEFDRFVRHNAWAKVDLPNSKLAELSYAYRQKRGLRFPFIPIPEKWFRYMQKRKMPKEIQEMANKDTRVQISDDVLKFHKNDRRQEVLEYMQNMMHAYDE